MATVTIASALACAGPVRAAPGTAYPVPTTDSGLHTIVAGPDGRMWFTEAKASKIAAITPAGQISEYPLPVADYVSDGPDGPSALTVSGGALWTFTDTGSNVYRVGTDGSVSPPVYHNLDDVDRGLSPAPGGGVWMTDNLGEEVRLLGAGGGDPQRFPADYENQISDPAPMATAADGSLYYGDDGGGDKSPQLKRVDPSGGQLNFPVARADGTQYFSSLAFDRGGNLWFTEYMPGSWFFTSSGGAIGVLRAGASTASDTKLTGTVVPHSIVLGPDGAMWFAGKNQLGRIDPATGTPQYVDLSPYQPASIAFAADGSLWLLDAGANQVVRIPSPGSLFATAGGGGSGGGGGTGGGGTTTKLPLAPKPTLTVPRTRLRGLARRPTVRVRCRLAGAGRCTVAAQVPAKVARGLHVKVKRKAKTATLAHGSHTFKRRGTATLTLRFSRALARRIARRRSLKLTFVATSSSPKHRNRTARRVLTLKR